ncbi:transposase, IS4 family [Ancylostoma caninum]|uniref:Transposase, IS4 family n=1 Tax=Ancylostoma caninum TaxID=29170 RepID=A0A368FCK4_ANCCA|nr:transposase, IS4 family [Ancylostoma caninum]
MNALEFVEFNGEEEERRSVPRVFRDRTRPYETLTDAEFRKDYRFSRPVFFRICEMLYEDLLHPSGRASDLPVADQVALAIHLLGRNVMQADCARIARKLKGDFFRKYGIPGIVGIIDCTHIPIIGPSENEEDYVNRKNYHSLNVGVIVDFDGKIRWVSTNWPGSAHDSRVFKSSLLYAQLKRGAVKGCLLGDSAYALESFLLKPLNGPRTPKEEKYNKAVCKARSIIERNFGIIKRRFHILHGQCRYKPVKAGNITVACCVLRNIAIDAKETNNYGRPPPPSKFPL